MKPINSVCVIGAGVMGAGIAAHAANAGASVILLDVVQGAAQQAIANMLKTKPAPFMHKSFAARITPGTTTDDLKSIKDCDWIIEAVIENPIIKQQLYADISTHMKDDAILSSNTSTLPIEILTKGMKPHLKRRFLITHFFNPPRYMRLLETVVGPATNSDAIASVLYFVDHRMGKSIVACNDTPGFIANRIGTFWLHAAITEAFSMNIGVEQADAVLSRPIGVPKTGVFGLIDLVGLDLMPHILDSFQGTLPPDDAFHALGPAPDFLTKMINDGYTGRKGKGGFYRLNEDRKKEAIDLNNARYTLAKRPKFEAVKIAKKEGLRAFFIHPSLEAKYAWSVMSKTLAYASLIAPDIADDVEAIDRAMRLGYNWKWGPFELIDKLGTAWFADQLCLNQMPVPKLITTANGRAFYDGLNRLSFKGAYKAIERPQGIMLLSDHKRNHRPILSNLSADVWDIGDGVACLEFKSKMNSLNPFILAMINRVRKELPRRGFKGLVIYNEGTNFSVGANIAMVLITAKLHLWPVMNWILKHGQNTFADLKSAPFPVVGAPSNMALGGGCEVLLHCDRIAAHSESYIGLVETGVGIIPGWGGCKELLRRWTLSKKRPNGPMPPVMKAFETIATAQVSTSAFEAKDLAFLSTDDEIVMNKERLLATAKRQVLNLAKDYSPPQPIEMHLPGAGGIAALNLAIRDFANKGVATTHDVTIARKLAFVLCGGTTDVIDRVSERDILNLERKAIIELAKTPETKARVEQMLKTGKPLRN